MRKHKQESDWTDAEIQGPDARVMDVIAKLNSRSTIKIILEDQSVGRRVVSGLNTIDNPEMLANDLAQLYDLHLTREGNRIILNTPPK